MAKPTGFIEYDRKEVRHRRVAERLKDYFEIDVPLSPEELTIQAARCMDCGIPFCHGYGCPVVNRIPEFNDLVYHGRWEDACEVLHRTNNFPEITGRICPAPCEAACTLNLNDDPVLIKHIEWQIVERGWEEGWIVPRPAAVKTGRRVAIVGSGPAGLAAAQQLARAGHDVTVYEKDEKPGGLLRFGIPDFKLDKRILDRRLEQMRAEGVRFENGVAVGEDVSLNYLRKRFDAILLAMGAGEPRNLDAPGRGLENVHFALEFLAQQNRLNAGLPVPPEKRISAEGKIVVVIGGGDTGSDCIGTANRQGAKEVHQFEILPEPPKERAFENPWPIWPVILRTSTSQEEGCTRRWSVLTKKLSGFGATVQTLHGCSVEWKRDEAGRMAMKEIPGSDFTMDVDLVLLAMGFVHVVHAGLVEELGLNLDSRGNIEIDENFMTSQPGVFAAGDAQRGASLVVWGIRDGRDAAAGVDRWLKEKI
ncbi:MAG: glutamate synthase subunit beta [Phycisphaerae bacterium]|nr:glutamate synthase subunit beta [Phycisphaerae bacterium]